MVMIRWAFMPSNLVLSRDRCRWRKTNNVSTESDMVQIHYPYFVVAGLHQDFAYYMESTSNSTILQYLNKLEIQCLDCLLSTHSCIGYMRSVKTKTDSAVHICSPDLGHGLRIQA